MIQFLVQETLINQKIGKICHIYFLLPLELDRRASLVPSSKGSTLKCTILLSHRRNSQGVNSIDPAVKRDDPSGSQGRYTECGFSLSCVRWGMGGGVNFELIACQPHKTTWKLSCLKTVRSQCQQIWGPFFFPLKTSFRKGSAAL